CDRNPEDAVQESESQTTEKAELRVRQREVVLDRLPQHGHDAAIHAVGHVDQRKEEKRPAARPGGIHPSLPYRAGCRTARQPSSTRPRGKRCRRFARAPPVRYPSQLVAKKVADTNAGWQAMFMFSPSDNDSSWRISGRSTRSYPCPWENRRFSSARPFCSRNSL